MSIWYFDANFSDKKKTARGILFNTSLRQVLEEFKEEGKSICVRNCEVKGEDKGNEIILTNKSSVVQVSDRKHDVKKPVEKTTKMEELGDLSVGQLGGGGSYKSGEGWGGTESGVEEEGD